MMTTRGFLIVFFITVAASASPYRFASATDASRGKAIYKDNCARCHGRSGKGNGYTKFDPPAADLTSSTIQHRLSDDLVTSVHRGRPNTAMGSWRLALSQRDIQDVVAYVRTLKE